ncbi:hypothetical protein BDV24DRAFT_134357 [Aspergillus arachidicola]|uniref:Uncharacterized protein n=1 Tax=Aspergillus arachidicola TaxID=656916 RepID=A0A5N6Y4N6_9EURO|nr:hypothetical protein BDV24DRAFT_134357 [Aspergillus arachidicola]
MRIRSYGRSTKNFLLAAAGNRPFGIGGTPSSMVSLCVVPNTGPASQKKFLERNYYDFCSSILLKFVFKFCSFFSSCLYEKNFHLHTRLSPLRRGNNRSYLSKLVGSETVRD